MELGILPRRQKNKRISHPGFWPLKMRGSGWRRLVSRSLAYKNVSHSPDRQEELILSNHFSIQAPFGRPLEVTWVIKFNFPTNQSSFLFKNALFESNSRISEIDTPNISEILSKRITGNLVSPDSILE